jgi:hypothetical protein
VLTSLHFTLPPLDSRRWNRQNVSGRSTASRAAPLELPPPHYLPSRPAGLYALVLRCAALAVTDKGTDLKQEPLALDGLVNKSVEVVLGRRHVGAMSVRARLV